MLLSITLSGFAQNPDYIPFPKDTAVWGYIEPDFNAGVHMEDHYLFIQMGDTVIFGKEYKKIYSIGSRSVYWTDEYRSWSSTLDLFFKNKSIY